MNAMLDAARKKAEAAMKASVERAEGLLNAADSAAASSALPATLPAWDKMLGGSRGEDPAEPAQMTPSAVAEPAAGNEADDDITLLQHALAEARAQASAAEAAAAAAVEATRQAKEQAAESAAALHTELYNS